MGVAAGGMLCQEGCSAPEEVPCTLLPSFGSWAVPGTALGLGVCARAGGQRVLQLLVLLLLGLLWSSAALRVCSGFVLS